MAFHPESTATRPQLIDVVGEVLGDLAFLVSDDSPPAQPTGLTWLEGEIHYEGPQRGRLRCWCSRTFAVQLAANLLGLDARDAQVAASADDAVREFMNVVCGQLVTAWHGREAVFNLSIPEVRERDETPRPQDGSDAWCGLAVSGEPFYCAYKAG
jgi:hypothetical protein